MQSGNIGRNGANFGPTRPHSADAGPNLIEGGPNLTEIAPLKSPNVGRCRAVFGPIRATSGRIEQVEDDVPPKGATTRKTAPDVTATRKPPPPGNSPQPGLPLQGPLCGRPSVLLSEQGVDLGLPLGDVPPHKALGFCRRRGPNREGGLNRHTLGARTQGTYWGHTLAARDSGTPPGPHRAPGTHYGSDLGGNSRRPQEVDPGVAVEQLELRTQGRPKNRHNVGSQGSDLDEADLRSNSQGSGNCAHA